MPDVNGPRPTPPACAVECGSLLREKLVALGVDANISWEPPLFNRGYEPLGMSCPHGVEWFVEPTNEQVAAYIRDGVA